ncbi:hypothetical protein HDU91_005913 [Kappamyces sp. JEL0680]|nr:hypothetical protein HDU91_005913 [Kappamyces sp. JEL0680]
MQGSAIRSAIAIHDRSPLSSLELTTIDHPEALCFEQHIDLSGNLLRHLEFVGHFQSVIELNLAHNLLESVEGIDRLLEAESVSGRTELTTVSSSYPLRLMPVKPHPDHPHHRAVFMLGFGGGMLANDSVHLSVSVGQNSSLTLLTQASTKVYKTPPGALGSFQGLDCHVAPEGFLAVLPEPVTCFQDAVYRQSQKFYLEPSSSLLLLDWITSGRHSRGEQWDFTSYTSENLIYIQNNLLLRDPWLLQNQGSFKGASIRDRMGPFSCCANLFLCGPRLDCVVAHVLQKSNDSKISKNSRTDSLIWSASRVPGNIPALVVRAAATDTITMRTWILDLLAPVLVPEQLGSYFSRI